MQERVRRPALSFYTRLDRLGPGRSSVDLAGPPSNDLSAGAGAREPARRRGDGEGDRRRQTVPEIVGNPTSAVADMSSGKATTTPIAPQTMQPQTKRLFSGLRAQRQSRLGAARNQPQSLPSRAQGYEEGRTSSPRPKRFSKHAYYGSSFATCGNRTTASTTLLDLGTQANFCPNFCPSEPTGVDRS